MTFPPEYDPTSQPGGGAQPGPMGSQPYGQPDQQYIPPGQTYGQPNEPYGGTPGAPPGMAPYQPGEPVGVPPFQPAGASDLASAARKRGIQQILIGAVLFVVGLIITVATYGGASSSPRGGTYFVAYGPMIFGVIGMIRGAIALAQAKKLG